MDKLSALRRNLLLRLIVFECEVAGYLELFETLLIGKATVADYKKLFGQLDLNQDKLKALHNAAIDITKQLKGNLELQRIDFLPNLNSGASLRSSFEYKIEEFESVVQHLNASAYRSKGEIDAPFLMRGILTKDPPRRYCMGRSLFQIELLGFSKVDPTLSTCAIFLDSSSHFNGFSRIDPIKPAANLFQINSSYFALSRLGFGKRSKGSLGIIDKEISFIRIAETYRKIFDFYIYDDWQAELAQNRNLLGQFGDMNYNAVNVAINTDNVQYPAQGRNGNIFLADTLLKGYIEIGGERATFGTFGIPGVFGATKATYKNEANGLMPLVKIYPQGTAIYLGVPRIHFGVRAIAQEILPIDWFGFARLGIGLINKKFFKIRQEEIYAKLTLRDNEQLLSSQRFYQFNIFSVISKPSYQDMMSAFGALFLKETLGIIHSCDLHKTMEYQFILDTENGGDTLEINTKYHQEVEGITYLGWRYFGYIIE